MSILQRLRFLADPAYFLILLIDSQTHLLLHIKPDLSLLLVNAVELCLCLGIVAFHCAHSVSFVSKFDLEIIHSPCQHSQVLIKHVFRLLLTYKFVLYLLEAGLILSRFLLVLLLHL